MSFQQYPQIAINIKIKYKHFPLFANLKIKNLYFLKFEKFSYLEIQLFGNFLIN